MRKVIGITLVGILFTLSTPAQALDRNAFIQQIRGTTGGTTTGVLNAYNINTVVINAAGSQITGGQIPANSLQTLSDVLAKIQTLKNRLRNLH